MTRRLLQPVWFLLAAIFLIEAWLWDHLEPWVARLVALIPLNRLKIWLSQRIERLSPPMTLIVFLVPVAPLYPLKLFGLWLFARHHWIAGVLIIAFAQFVGLGVAAFIFDVTRPKLLRMRWFARLYGFLLTIRARARAIVSPIMTQIRAAIGSSGEGWTRTLRMVRRFRRNVHLMR